VHGFDAHTAAVKLFGDSIAANMFMLGYAYQLGTVPIGAEAIEQAIELNGAAVEMSRNAFRFGRLAAPPGGKTYGALTVGVQAVARVEKLFTVPAGAFTPPPKVESAVVRLVPLAEPMVKDAEVAAFRRLVVGLFGFRRKQLVRGLRELTGWPAERVTGVLERAGLAASARPETVEPRGFADLLGVLIDGGWRPD
jgi:16S rRNA A1518/A1519 N6-dimethyltransferase RsmA/KsgA/DIM1 with predicted DNA glycosylase/AP lyase activity